MTNYDDLFGSFFRNLFRYALRFSLIMISLSIFIGLVSYLIYVCK